MSKDKTGEPKTYRNHLAQESSPYLLQHAGNPVDWYPWGEAALQKARVEDKLILLSIGYSACHWCHVMAHESFEDETTAALMNQRYVNIKVDREERPDIDKIYQLAHQVMMRRGGGWPLTVMLTPEDHLPLFTGTYFPPQPRYNMPAFSEVLRRVADFYQQRREDVVKQNDSFRRFLDTMAAAETRFTGDLSTTLLDQARQQLEKHYDGLFGGFGEAPKFPHPTNIERLLRHWHATALAGNPDHAAKEMALTTLKAMALGGIYDQLGGGFCRYSVDQEWMIPHFEKMLYDNGPLLTLYAEAACITTDAEEQRLFTRIALETGDWVMREMQAASGGYYSSLDADSQGHEGKYYAWSTDEVRSLLDTEDYALFAARFGLDKTANFEGAWHLHVYESAAKLAARLDLPLAEINARLDQCRATLFRERDLRVAPGRDEKILTAWNGLMIKGMAAAGRRLNRPDFIQSAQAAVDFIYREMRRGGRLLASYKDGKARHRAYLDDYAFLLDGLLELLQARWRTQDYHFALALADNLLEYYEDGERGGFYFTANDHEALIQRPKPYSDEAIPAGNGIAAVSLLRLGYLSGVSLYLTAAERCLRAAWGAMSQTPYAHNAMLLALEEYLQPTARVIIRGSGADLRQWQQWAQTNYRPRQLLLAIDNVVDDLPTELQSYRAATTTLAYVCRGAVCQAPITDFVKFKTALESA